MENASKALIIAGSVLLAVLLVAFGVAIFNNARSNAGTESLDSAEISMFNQKFEKYSGDQLGSQVKTLLSSLISNAGTNKDDQIKLPSLTVLTTSINGGNSAVGSNIQTYINSIGNARNSINSKTRYNVMCYYGTTGLINSIKITAT